MIYLLLVSLIWAFSFGLIKTNLTPINPILVTMVRLAFATMVFLPVFRFRKLNRPLAYQLILIGILQFGLMYLFYNLSFQYLKAYEVALFTIFTPFYVALTDNMMERKWNSTYILTAVIAIIGTAIIKYTDISRPGLLLGFLIVQASNICFAIGQVLYRRVMRKKPDIKDSEIFAVLYTGGFLIASVVSVFLVDWSTVAISSTQWWNLIYLGILASGCGFFLWNFGARRTNIGALAIFNNLKIPLSITVSLLFFNEQANMLNLLLGGMIIVLALAVNEIIDFRKHRLENPT